MKEEYRMRAEESEQHIQELLEKVCVCVVCACMRACVHACAHTVHGCWLQTREQAAQLEGLSMMEDQLEEMKHLEEKVVSAGWREGVDRSEPMLFCV